MCYYNYEGVESSFDCFCIAFFVYIPLILQNGRLFFYSKRLPIVSVNQIIDLGRSDMGTARQIIDLGSTAIKNLERFDMGAAQ